MKALLIFVTTLAVIVAIGITSNQPVHAAVPNNTSGAGGLTEWEPEAIRHQEEEALEQDPALQRKTTEQKVLCQ